MSPASRGMTLSSVMTSHVISTDSLRSLVQFPASVSKAKPVQPSRLQGRCVINGRYIGDSKQ